MNLREIAATIVTWLIVITLVLGLLFGVVATYQWIKVYSATQTGKAELARAQGNRQIAKLDAEAEVARARGVAQANEIVAQGLGGPEGYLRYLSIEAMKNQEGKVIYVPTEAGIPITEASRFNKPQE